MSEPANVGYSIATASPGPSTCADDEVDGLAGTRSVTTILVGSEPSRGAGAVLGQALAQREQALDRQVLQPRPGVAQDRRGQPRHLRRGQESWAGKPAASGITSRPAPSDSASICSA